MIEEILAKYEAFLTRGTNESLGRNDTKMSRYATFLECAQRIEHLERPVILELGTCRSYVDGAYEGCNSSDTAYWRPNSPEYWDWGAGCFGIVFGLMFPNAELISLDLYQSHIDRSKTMMDSLGIKCEHVVSDSVEYLNRTDKKFDLIYIDTGDMWPIEPTCALQLNEATAIVNRGLLNDGGILLVDDVLNKTPREKGIAHALGKSQLSLPYLVANGFDIVCEAYQYVLAKNEK